MQSPAGAGPLVIGVDGGGSKTVAVAADGDGSLRGIGRSGGSNHEGVGLDGAAAAIRAAIDGALVAAGVTLSAVAWIHVGLAGMDWPADRVAMEPALRATGIDRPLTIENDAFLIPRAGSPDGCGIGVGAGSGVCCCIIPRRGVPYFFGSSFDIGFGCDIAGRAWEAVVQAADGRGPATVLTAALLQAYGCVSTEELVYRRCRQPGALPRVGLMPAVFRVANAGDPVAVAILTDFARVFVTAVATVIARYGLRGEAVPVVAGGSRFTRSGPLLFDLFRRGLRAAAPLAVPILSEREPVLGAVRAALAAAGMGDQTWRSLCDRFAQA